MKWSLAKFVLLVAAAAVAVGSVRGQKYRDEVQRDGVRPKKITLESCERAFKHADPSHTLCWRNEHSKLVTGTVAKHDQWCTKQIRKFDSNRNVEGKYKMSDCQKLTMHAETAERKYDFMHKLYMQEAGVDKDPNSWKNTANSFLLWSFRKVMQGVTLGKIKKPEIPPTSIVIDARVAAMALCKAAKRSVCKNGKNTALIQTMEKFETALSAVDHATNEVKKWYAAYDQSTSFTITALKATKFAGYCAAVVAAGPLVTKASAAGATTFLGAKGASVAAGAGVATAVTATHEVADQVGRIQVGLQNDFAWRKVVEEAAKAGTIHAVAGGIWLTKGGKAVVRKIADKFVARVANSKALKSIAKLADDGKFAYLKQNFKYLGFKKALEKVGTSAEAFSKKTRTELVNIVFSKLTGLSKAVIKGVISGYQHFQKKPEACKHKDCFTNHVVKDLEKRIAKGEDEDFEELREQLTEVLEREYERRGGEEHLDSSEVSSSQSSLKDNGDSRRDAKKSPWSAAQVKKCTRRGGTCLNKNVDDCAGKFVSNLCPGSVAWKCCVD
eukprot:g15803.t1